MKGTAHRASTAHPAITFIGRLALAALILVVLVEVYFLARGFNLYREAIEEAGLDEMAASIQSSESFTPIDELPDLYLQAVVAVEDHRFYAHPGFDAIATARALVNDLKAGAIVEGGSTITQQLAKNQYFTQEQTVERKIAEVFMALTMEQHFSKRTILELYVNSIYFGDGYEGIGSASWGISAKPPARSMPTNARCWPASRTRRACTRCLRTLASRASASRKCCGSSYPTTTSGRTQHSTFWETCARWPHDAPSHRSARAEHRVRAVHALHAGSVVVVAPTGSRARTTGALVG